MEAGPAVLSSSDGPSYPQVLDDDRPVRAAEGLKAEGTDGSRRGR